MTRGEVTYRWVQMGSKLVPTYKLTRLVNAITTENVVAGYTGDVVVAQDINKERWLWGFSLRKKKRDTQASGHAATLEEAQEAAELAAGKLGGP
jgi:hypothetical protein